MSFWTLERTSAANSSADSEFEYLSWQQYTVQSRSTQADSEASSHQMETPAPCEAKYFPYKRESPDSHTPSVGL